MNKFQALAALILDEVRSAELATLNHTNAQEAEAVVLERLESFLRHTLSDEAANETAPTEESQPDDLLSLPDPSANLNLGDRWKWKPGAS